ncbi:ribose/xylose/arabinose/galactoside ABC-type transport system permease subunit [Pedobacter sp. UYEF25]
MNDKSIEMGNSIADVLLAFAVIVSQFLVFGTCVYLLLKFKGIDAILLTLGSGFSALMSIFYRILPVFSNTGSLPMENLPSIYAFAGFFSAIFYVIFAIGFLMFVLKATNQAKQYFSQFPPTNY